MASPRPNILVIKLGALGDFIQALGPMAAIRHHHKNAHLTLLTTKPFAEFAKASGYFDVIIIDTRPKFYELSKWLSLRLKLNGGHYSRVYDLQNNDRTSFYFKLFSVKPEWVGIAKGASHRNTSPERTKSLAYYGHVQTLGLAGIENVGIDALSWVSGEETFDGLSSPYVLIVAGSAPSHPEKRWPAKHYITLCNILCDHGFQPVLIGSSGEAETLTAIHTGAPKSLNLCGKTSLFDIVALSRNAAAALGNDTGPMHLIAPTGCKTIVLFSKHTNPKRHAPLGPALSIIQSDNLEDLLPDVVWKKFLDQQAVS